MILPFELDPQIIHHIIHNQAGSIGKAIIELIMNSVDAGAKTVRLTLSNEGFVCEDDGNGFVTKDDVLNYFGRFGTPHLEGDATYGRFRLGRGQIMAHASTIWLSNDHQMFVDTLQMGYSYDLTQNENLTPGCHITGTWYEKLSNTELLSTMQEIRDLVRYTPAAVELNGKIITREPAAEKWDYEDENAYYRVKLEGAVSIYNQGILVKHDASHIWGVGGLIVTKKAISLNVSRTEILRKTCSVWKEISKHFQEMAIRLNDQLNDNRKTEARREKSVRSLLSGEGNLWDLLIREEVITILPGNRHITLDLFYRRLDSEMKNKCCIIENHYDIPKAEAMAKANLTMFIHPKTLDRFGVHTPEQFLECLGLISENYKQFCEDRDHINNFRDGSTPPILLDYDLLSAAFIERMEILNESKALDRETKRVWTALRWCLQQYAGACLGKRMYRNGAIAYREDKFSILIGYSNTAEAWTDGQNYIAFNVDVVKKLKGNPLKTAAYIFSLLEHELAHEGDSLDAGHDEVFYQRYHDISIQMSSERQRYMHMWLMKYRNSLEGEGKKKSSQTWSELSLIERIGNGRIKKGLGEAIEDLGNDPVVQAFVPEENQILIAQINSDYHLRGLTPNAPQWEEILKNSLYTGSKENSATHNNDFPYDDDEDHMYYVHCFGEDYLEDRKRICSILGINDSELDYYIYSHLEHESEENVREMWDSKPWEIDAQEEAEYYINLRQTEEKENEVKDQFPSLYLDEECRQYIEEGETLSSLDRNAAAAGFRSIEKYLLWRANS
jgi:hypothetical protein